MTMLTLGSTATRTYSTHVSEGEVADGRYIVKIADTSLEIESALRLRYEVFSVELSDTLQPDDPSRLEYDDHDLRCRHLIVIDRISEKTVGTYRLNTMDHAGSLKGFYSYNEFSIEDLPPDVLSGGVEIGRACIAPAHRNTKVLFLLWRGLAAFLQTSEKRYFFGCCSIFTRDRSAGAEAYLQLVAAGHLHKTFRVTPRWNEIDVSNPNDAAVELPNLFNMYLRIGAKVCGPPTVDHDFGTIDFFVVCDTEKISGKYRRMFFSGQNEN